MTTDFLPTREADLVTWTNNFATLLVASPTTYAISAGQASAYQTLSTAFVDAHATANNDMTRSPANITIKNMAKRAMIANARMLARIIQAAPAVTPAQKQELGLNPRDVIPSPIPVPETSPDIDVMSVVGWNVKIRIHDSQAASKRSKPAGVYSAGVFSFVGPVAPTDPAQYKFEGITTRNIVDIAFPSTVASGSTVWVAACWYNPRGQSGFACQPIKITIQGGSALPEAA